MQPETFKTIVQNTDATKGKGADYSVSDGYRVSLHMAGSSQGWSVRDVKNLKIAEQYVELLTEDEGSVFVSYESILAITAKKKNTDTSSRAGFA